MIQQTPTVSFRKQLLEGVHDFRTTGNTFRIALYSSSATLNFSTVSWAASGLTARGALIYNSDATGYTNPSVMVLDFGMDRSDLSGVFTITFPTFNSSSAIIRVS